MNRILKTLALAAPLLSATLLTPGSADACGGCFIPPTTSTVVSGHRMAISISMQRTVLWDQIQYQGNPEDFSWVLPIKPGARIEEATSEWFETLEASTVTQVTAPPLNCGNNGQAFGCGSSNGFASPSFAGGEDSGGGGVTVVHQETIGPYDSVTLSSTDPAALTSWLESHGYAIPDDIQPVIDAYVTEGFDFIALRLTPGNGVNLMQPVRVITDGASPVLPLRMVSAGTGPFTSVILYVIGEGRWTTANFPEAQVPWDKLIWDGSLNDSNYSQLRIDTMAQAGGRTWISTFAQRDAMFNYSYDEDGNYTGGQIGYTYFQQLNQNGDNYQQVDECRQRASSAGNGLVVDTCDPVTKQCGQPGAGQTDARDFTCGELTDLSVALTGMHPNDVWVTRLEANLPRTALSDDLELGASSSQSTISNFHIADNTVNYECPATPVTGVSRKGAPPANSTAVVLAGLGALAALLIARRRGLIRA